MADARLAFYSPAYVSGLCLGLIVGSSAKIRWCNTNMCGSAVRSLGFFFLRYYSRRARKGTARWKITGARTLLCLWLLIMKDSALWVLYDGLPCDTARVSLGRRIDHLQHTWVGFNTLRVVMYVREIKARCKRLQYWSLIDNAQSYQWTCNPCKPNNRNFKMPTRATFC